MKNTYTLEYKIKVMQAAKAGKLIEEFHPLVNKWVECADPDWDWSINGYRVKTLPVMIRHYRQEDFVSTVTTGFNSYEDQTTKQVLEYPDVEWLDEWHEAMFLPDDSTE